jgi:hypothetical protein
MQTAVKADDTVSAPAPSVAALVVEENENAVETAKEGVETAKEGVEMPKEGVETLKETVKASTEVTQDTAPSKVRVPLDRWEHGVVSARGKSVVRVNVIFSGKRQFLHVENLNYAFYVFFSGKR